MARPTRRDAAYQRNRKILLADSPTCYWCKRRPATTADHLIELDRAEAAGLPGQEVHALSNLVPACASCNSSRGATYGNQKRGKATKARNAAVAEAEARRRTTKPAVFKAEAPHPFRSGRVCIPLNHQGF